MENQNLKVKCIEAEEMQKLEAGCDPVTIATIIICAGAAIAGWAYGSSLAE